MSKKSPQLRFEGFTDDWEQRKLSGIIEKLSGGASIKPTDYLEDGIRTIPKGAVNATGIADLSCSKYISEDFFEKNITSHAHTSNLVTSLRDLVPSAPNMGRIVRIEGDDEQFLMPQGVYKLELFEGMDEDFLISFSNSDKYRKIISAEKNGSTQVHIRNGEFLNIDINLPSEHEQKKIGSFFKQLDNTIALHQRKLDLLKEQKKGYLQKMFPKNGAKVPELRFAGFVDDWEERKLGDISYKVKEKNKTGEFTETLTNSAEYGIINQRDFFDKDISNAKNLTGYYVVKNDDFVYNPRISNFAPVGPIKRNKLGRTGVMSPLYYVFRTHDIDKNYFEKYFDTVYWHRFMELNGDSGARADRFAIKDSVFVEMPIPYPTMDEQQKIGSFFQQLDNTITLHQLKLDLLKEQKKGFLQKMFA